MFQFPLLSIPIVQRLLYIEMEMQHYIRLSNFTFVRRMLFYSKQTNVLTWWTTISVKNELFLWIRPKPKTFYPTRSNKTDDATDTTAVTATTVTLSKHRNYFIWCRLLEMLFFFRREIVGWYVFVVVVLPIFTRIVRIKNVVYGVMLS